MKIINCTQLTYVCLLVFFLIVLDCFYFFWIKFRCHCLLNIYAIIKQSNISNGTNCNGYWSCSVIGAITISETGGNCDDSDSYSIEFGFSAGACNQYNDSHWYQLSCDGDSSVEFSIFRNNICTDEMYDVNWNVSLQSIVLDQYSSYLDSLAMVVCDDAIQITSCSDTWGTSESPGARFVPTDTVKLFAGFVATAFALLAAVGFH